MNIVSNPVDSLVKANYIGILAWAVVFGLAFGRCLGEYGSIVFIAGNKPYYTEITPLIIMSELQEFDYSSATAIALVMLAVSFFILFLNSMIQQRNARILRGGNA